MQRIRCIVSFLFSLFAPIHLNEPAVFFCANFLDEHFLKIDIIDMQEVLSAFTKCSTKIIIIDLNGYSSTAMLSSIAQFR